MPVEEAVNEVLSLVELCKSKYTEMYSKAPTNELLVMMVDRAHHRLLSDSIQASRKSKPTAQKSMEPRMASQKQLDYIKDLGGHVTDNMTSAEASRMIEDLRK